jgi:hypothetical protein
MDITKPLWPFIPNWKDPVIERLSWLTDVLTSTSGAEQRRGLRQVPRRRLEASFLLEGNDRQKFDLLLAANANGYWTLPIWTDMQYLKDPLPVGTADIYCSTLYRDFEDGEAILLISDAGWEVIDEIWFDENGLYLQTETSMAHPAGTRLYPLRNARLVETPEITRHTDRLVEFTAAFEIVDFRAEGREILPESTPLQYRSCSVYLDRPVETEDLTDTFEHITSIVDVGVGKTYLLDVAKRRFPVRMHRWLLPDLESLARLKSLLYMLRGRQAAAWLPTHMDDLSFVAEEGGREILIRNCGYSSLGLSRLGRQDIAIWTLHGFFLRRIDEARVDEHDPSLERITVNSLLPPLLPHSVLRISYLALMRLADDEVEIEHITGDNGISRVAATFRAVRDDLEAPLQEWPT